MNNKDLEKRLSFYDFIAKKYKEGTISEAAANDAKKVKTAEDIEIFLDKYYNKDVEELVDAAVAESNQPSDYIFLTEEADTKLKDIWSAGKEIDIDTIPSDIFFAGTIPLMNCEISIKQETALFEGVQHKARFSIFDNYKEYLNAVIDDDKETMIVVGCCFIELTGEVLAEKGIKKSEVIAPLFVWPGKDAMIVGAYELKRDGKVMQCLNLSALMNDECMPRSTLIFIRDYFASWYSIQIALLHPTLKDMFSHPTKNIIYDANAAKKNKNKKKKRITRYVQHHNITESDFDKATIDRTFNRKTPVWYVIGHWRTYKTSKKVFVNGYLKGELREIKMNLDEGRQRVIESKVSR